MAYKEKYFLPYCDGNSKEFRLSILEWDWGGSATELVGAPVPFTVSRETSSELKQGGIYPSRATITLASGSGFSLEELYTADERKYFVEHKATDGSDDGKWYGHIIPNGFSEQMDDDVHYMVLVASDDLPTLQGVLFTQPDGTNYGLPDGDFEQSFLWVAKEALKKTGIPLPIWTMVDIKPLITNNITSVTQGIIRWGANELRTDPPVDTFRAQELMDIIRPGYSIVVRTGEYVGEEFTVSSVVTLNVSSVQRIVSITVAETVPSDLEFTEFDVYEPATGTGLVLARRGHFNDVSPSEIGIYKEGVDFGFLAVGDTLKVSGSTNNDGSYTVTGFLSSVPPDSPYIRIQLSPQVPQQIHENVTIEIISNDVEPSDPLDITVHDVRVYVRDKDIEGKNYYEVIGSAMSAWDVLNNLAKQWNVEIYQNRGRWEIVRINAHEKPDAEYEYFIYNSEGVQTAREAFGETVTYPCLTLGTALFRPKDHTISMDRVLGAVGVNYVFRFKQEGDSLVNLIKNGNFDYTSGPGIPPPSSTPSTFTPQQWQRRNYVTGGIPALMFLDAEYWPGPTPWPVTPYFPPGFSSFLKVAGYYHNRLWLTSYSGYPTNVNAGDELRIKWWQRVPLQRTIPGVLYGYGISVVRINIVDDFGTLLQSLVNSGQSLGPSANTAAQWHAYGNDNIFPAFVTATPQGIPSPDGMSAWGEVDIVTPPVPVNGHVVVEIVGVGASVANPSAATEPGLIPTTFPAYFPAAGGGTVLRQWNFVSRELWISGVFVAKIVDPSNEAVAQIHPYWYANDGAYTDSIDDIEVLTGDDDNPDHVSNIYVMDGVTKRAVSSWDSWASDYGWGALGLILAKSIMAQYYRPWRVIDGDFVAPSMDWASRFQFGERPGERYKILRGTLMPSENRFSGTLVQVFDNATPELPPGGNDGGGSTEPNWQPTGTVRCVRDENGENTGDAEQLEVDMNPSSQTSGQQRWVNIGGSTSQCPIGDPIDFYWGASALPISIDMLQHFPIQQHTDNYTVQFTNDGTGKYLVFLWRKSLGTVRSILDVELEETLSSWQLEPDMVINGYAFGVIRMSYMTGVFDGLYKVFKVN